ncbi:DUF885 family protein [Sinomicrobium soli]|uniref:DUF885 family protein n=1 Tax=Sinomicrobium sp. N-1-3-6 TaxID=2219864 RepID=UPI000DCF43AB|nr:DUF885 family protein [Sinomicrobium sp. N-1-3-6]RAV27629.1 DUF885 domain-containing protein [Sinomicrobium sp. N-1-3-6]
MKLLNTLIFLVSVCGIAQAGELTDVVSTYQADKQSLRSTYTIRESEEYYRRFGTFYTGWEKKLGQLDFNTLDQEGKADYIMLSNLIAREHYQLQQQYKAFKEVAHVTGFAGDIYAFVKERRRGAKPDAPELARAFTQVSEKIREQMEVLKGQPFADWVQADKAAAVVTSLSKPLKEAYAFYYGYDPDFTWWMEGPYKKLAAALGEYREFLFTNYSDQSTKDDGSGIIGKPAGRDGLMKELEFEFIPYTPEALIAAARKQFDWCKEEMIRASRELGYGDDWKAALEHVKETYVPAGEQPEAIYELYRQSVDFIRKRDLITLPELAEETWGMIMMTPERQKVNPFFTGGWEISISYPTTGMSQEDKLMSMRGNNPNFSRATVQHELLPGHNLQFFMNARHKTYRRAFDTPFWMEGWALYWEIILWNKGFPQTPEQKMGMLFWRIHRCARIIFSLKYHLGEMTPQECIDMLVDEVGHEYANAEAEVRRSFATTYTPPLYQVAYMIGGLQFYALRNELLEKGWTEKQFHDRVMKENFMPVEILRAVLTEQPLKQNFKTRWKFSTEFE